MEYGTRGVIQNRSYGKQIVDFRDLRYGAITPTDIDGFLDFQNKLFIFIELKHGNTEVKTGQRLALERICDASRVPAWVLVARHDAYHDADIDAANAIVTAIYHGGAWWPPEKIEETTLRNWIDWIRRHTEGLT